jgi:hypothetical protein
MNSSGLFENIPDDVLSFGRGPGFDAKRVADWLNLDKSEVSRISSVAQTSVRYDDNMPRPVHDRLEEIALICNQVARIFDGDVIKTALWFKTKNPLLGDISPRDMVRLGRYDRLRKFIISAIADRNMRPAA